MSETRRKPIMERALIAILSVALIFTMMPLSMGLVFAADASEFQPALTITGPDGNKTVYQTREDVIKAFSPINDDSLVEGTTLKGIAVKKLLSGFDDDAVVTVKTQDDYTGTLNANGKTVKELKELKGLLAYQEGDAQYDPTSDAVDAKGRKLYGGYFIFYVGKDSNGKVMKDKWVNQIIITKSSSEGDDPQPAPSTNLLEITGDDLVTTLSFETIQKLKNDENIKPLIKEATFHTLNSYGTEEDFTVEGVTFESLIKLAGLKEGKLVKSLTVTADAATSPFTKEYTGKQVMAKDLQGNKMMFIWKENNDKVQKTAVGQFKKTDVNRSLWVRGNTFQVVVATKDAVPGKVTIKSVKAGKKQATVTWKEVTDTDGYVVYRSTKKNKGFKAVKTINDGKTVKFVNKKLKKGKTYYFKVKAYNNGPDGKIFGSSSAVKSVKIK